MRKIGKNIYLEELENINSNSNRDMELEMNELINILFECWNGSLAVDLLKNPLDP